MHSSYLLVIKIITTFSKKKLYFICHLSSLINFICIHLSNKVSVCGYIHLTFHPKKIKLSNVDTLVVIVWTRCVISVSEVRLECRSDKSTLSVESGGSTSVGGRHFDGSTPTWTEGTPSFTESSSSGDMGRFLFCFVFFLLIICLFIFF